MNLNMSRLLEALTPREHQFFACMCCRSIYDCLIDASSKNALIVAEQFLLGEATKEELIKARDTAYATAGKIIYDGVNYDKLHAAAYAAAHTASAASANTTNHAAAAARNASYTVAVTRKNVYIATTTGEQKKQVIFSNEVHNPGKDFKHPDAAQMARAIRQERAWDQIKYLGDLLQDLGCDDKVILDHCYQDIEHGLGCWVVEMILK